MRLFCYGTLMFPEVMQRVTGRHFEGSPVILDDYGCYTVNGHAFPGVVRESGAVTQGLVYVGIGDTLLHRLDLFEGDLDERRRVCVPATTGRPLQARAYVVPAASRGLLSRQSWDRQTFEREHTNTSLPSALSG